MKWVLATLSPKSGLLGKVVSVGNRVPKIEHWGNFSGWGGVPKLSQKHATWALYSPYLCAGEIIGWVGFVSRCCARHQTECPHFHGTAFGHRTRTARWAYTFVRWMLSGSGVGHEGARCCLPAMQVARVLRWVSGSERPEPSSGRMSHSPTLPGHLLRRSRLFPHSFRLRRLPVESAVASARFAVTKTGSRKVEPPERACAAGDGQARQEVNRCKFKGSVYWLDCPI